MERFDIAIIGTGPAGLSAAVTAQIRRKNILLIGSKELSDKLSRAHKIQNYLGLPDISGKELQYAFLKHIKSMGIEITEDKVNGIYSFGDYFAIQGISQIYEATSVILATGMFVAKPISGELEHLGRGVSYCATCDAALYRGRSAIVVSFSEKEEGETEFLAQVADRVYYYPQYKNCKLQDAKIEVISDEKPLSIEKSGQCMKLITRQGSKTADGVFILREQSAPSQLVPGLKTTENHVDVDRRMQTNLEGLFACGDITGTPYQYIKAAGEGNIAALSAVNYIYDKKK